MFSLLYFFYFEFAKSPERKARHPKGGALKLSKILNFYLFSTFGFKNTQSSSKSRFLSLNPTFIVVSLKLIPYLTL